MSDATTKSLPLWQIVPPGDSIATLLRRSVRQGSQLGIDGAGCPDFQPQ